MHALIDESLHIWDRLKQFPQFSQEAECHIEGAMQDPAEPPSAADAEPPEAPDAEPPLLADLAQEFLEAPEAPEAQADTFWNDWPDLTEQFEETPEAPPGPPSSEHAEPTEFLYADANRDDWELPGMASSNSTSEAEQISKAQSSQPAHQHSLQHQQHKREKSANYWRHNTPTQEQGSQDTEMLMKQNTLNPRLFLAVWPVVNRWIREGLEAEADRRGSRSILRRCWLVWAQDILPPPLVSDSDSEVGLWRGTPRRPRAGGLLSKEFRMAFLCQW